MSQISNLQSLTRQIVGSGEIPMDEQVRVMDAFSNFVMTEIAPCITLTSFEVWYSKRYPYEWVFKDADGTIYAESGSHIVLRYHGVFWEEQSSGSDVKVYGLMRTLGWVHGTSIPSGNDNPRVVTLQSCSSQTMLSFKQAEHPVVRVIEIIRERFAERRRQIDRLEKELSPAEFLAQVLRIRLAR